MHTQWTELEKKLKSFNNFVKKPDFKGSITTSMPRTFLLGNGDLGIVSSGSGVKKEYLIGKNDFWSCGDLKTDDVMNFNSRRVTTLQVGKLTVENLKSHKLFCEKIDLSTASLKSIYDDITITAYCLADTNALAISILSKNDINLKLTVSVPDNCKDYAFNYFNENGKGYVQRSTADFAENEKSWTSSVALYLIDFEKEIKEISHTENEINYQVQIKSNIPKHLVLCVGGGGKIYDGNKNLIDKTAYQQANDIETLFKSENDFLEKIKSHKKWWREYWCASSVNLSDNKLEKYYYTSLYIMACCSRENKMPPGLYGNFITTDNPKWNGDFHMNYNFIAPFYGMYAANRPEFAKSLAQPILDFIPEAKRRAKEDLKLICREYICGGIYKGNIFKGRNDLRNGIDNAVLYHVALGPYGASAWNGGKAGGYWKQMNDAAFTATGLTAYYFYTLDKNYFQKIFDFLELNINFFLSWREKEILQDGNYRYVFWSGAHEGSFELNAPHVIGSVKNILMCVLDGVNRGYSAVDSKKIEIWQDFLDHLPEYPIRNAKYGKFLRKKNVDNVLALGEKGLIYNKDSATVSLEFIHPCEDMDFDSDDNVKNASKNTINLYKSLNFDNFRQVNNLPKIFIHAIRCGYSPEKVLFEFKRLYRKDFMTNYTVKDYGDTHGIEKSGGIEFINSMLLSSDVETIKVFPNWLKNKDAEFVNLRARGAFLVSSSYSAKKQCVKRIEIVSTVQDKIQIYNEFENPVIIAQDNSFVDYTEIKDKHGRTILCFSSVPNVKYIISEKLK